MRHYHTPLGEVYIGDRNVLFRHLSDRILELIRDKNYPPGVALTGGSSPKAYFDWLLEYKSDYMPFQDQVIFTVSDERMVPIESEESNFGNAQRMLLEPFGVEPDNRFSWDTSRPASEAADWYEKLWGLSFGEGNTYDLCMLGMGEDCHTASLFPGSPLLSGAGSSASFAAVEVPGKGQRLTITPEGMGRCGLLLLLVMGSSKSNALAKVFEAPEENHLEVPARLMRHFKDKVVWLVDPEAAVGVDWKKE